jgi:hypothetical protein
VVEEEERNGGCDCNQAATEPAGDHPEKFEYTKTENRINWSFSPEQFGSCFSPSLSCNQKSEELGKGRG